MSQAQTHKAYKAQLAPVWIGEKEAAQQLGLKPRTFRIKVKNGAIPVNYSTPSGRRYLYNRVDLDRFLMDNSTMVAK